MDTRLLIADSDEALLEIYQSYFWDQGYEVEVASDGLECVRTLREFRPDVLVLEWEILWGGGDGVLAVLREDFRRIPAILTFGCLTERDFARMLVEPVAVWLPKPLRLSSLTLALRTALAAPSANDAVEYEIGPHRSYVVRK